MVDQLERFEEKYTDGQIIFCEYEPGDSFYFIKSGNIKLVKIIDNKESIVDILKAGTFFGEMAVIESSARSATAIAIGDLVLMKFPAENFQDIILQNVQFLIRLIKIFANRIFVQQQKLKIYSYKSPMLRVLAFLNSLKKAKKKNDEKLMYIVQSSSSDVSKWVGLPVNECNSVLKKLAQRRMINVLHDSIIILDDKMLTRELSLRESKDEEKE